MQHFIVLLSLWWSVRKHESISVCAYLLNKYALMGQQESEATNIPRQLINVILSIHLAFRPLRHFRSIRCNTYTSSIYVIATLWQVEHKLTMIAVLILCSGAQNDLQSSYFIVSEVSTLFHPSFDFYIRGKTDQSKPMIEPSFAPVEI